MTSQAQYRKRLEQGMCGECAGRPRTPGRVLCAICRARHRARYQGGSVPTERIPDALRAERNTLQARIREIDRLLGEAADRVSQ